jgi:hypothetical protein
MTDAQLYLAIGIPSALFALNFLAIIWQARGLERSFNVGFDALEQSWMRSSKSWTQDLRR